MKTIGLIGGMSWESTAHYYALLNKNVNERLGGHHSAKILLYSIDFEELATRQSAGEWDGAGAIVVNAAKRLERGGADFLLIGAKTMHIAAGQVEQAVSIPLLILRMRRQTVSSPKTFGGSACSVAVSERQTLALPHNRCHDFISGDCRPPFIWNHNGRLRLIVISDHYRPPTSGHASADFAPYFVCEVE